MDLNEKTYTSNLISSIGKIYNQSRLDGKLHVEDLYILNAVYKLLTDCETALTEVHIKILNNLYINIINSSKYLCTSKKYSSFAYISQKPFVQAERDDCNSLPIQDLIYYWQEPLGITSEAIMNNIETGTYLDTKLSDLKSIFEEGKDINYSDIGLICFALNKVSVTDQYFIYDDDNNANVTGGFESFYNYELKTRIFISINNYSYGIMNFKIKKI